MNGVVGRFVRFFSGFVGHDGGCDFALAFAWCGWVAVFEAFFDGRFDVVGALLVSAFSFSFDVVLVLIAGAICLVVIADFVDGFVDGFAGVLTTLAATGGA